MRYRRMSYRYAVLVGSAQPQPLGEPWPGERGRLAFAPPHWRPPADVYETSEAITVTAELAGVDPEEVDVLLFEDALVVEGERHLPKCEEGALYHSAEIRRGRFRLELSLKVGVDADRVTSSYDCGFLRITLPKANGR